MGGLYIIPDRDSNGKTINAKSPFASKHVSNGSLYKRVHGIKQLCSLGNTTFNFVVSYPNCKITGAEFIGAPEGCTADFFILDTATGTVTTIPNYPLNQFGFNVNVGKDLYEHTSEYDADLFQGLQISIVLNSPIEKSIGVNFILNEVKA